MSKAWRLIGIPAAFIVLIFSLAANTIAPVSAAVPLSLDLTPFYAINSTGTSHTVTATLTDDSGSPIQDQTITFRIISGPHSGLSGTGTTNTAGQTTWSYNGTSAGTDTIVASGDGITSKSITKEWYVPGPPTLSLTPSYALNSIGTSHEITATLKDDSGSPIPDITITFEILDGPNSGWTDEGMNEVNTDEAGQATWSYTGDSAGTDTIVASGDGVTSSEITKEWYEPGPATLSLTPSYARNSIGTSNEITATLTDASGSPMPDKQITFEILDGPNSGWTDEGMNEVITDEAGQATWSYTGNSEGTDTIVARWSERPLGINTTETTTQSDIINSANTVTIFGDDAEDTSNEITSEWYEPGPILSLNPFYAINNTGTSHNMTAILTDDSGSPIPHVPITFNIISGPHAPLTGVISTNDDGQAAWSYNGIHEGTDIIVASGDGVTSSEITKEWHLPLPPTLNLDPFYDFNSIGTSHTVTATLTNDSGSPIPGITIAFNIISGPHSGLNGSGTTNEAGQTAWSYNGTSPGTDTIVASGAGVTSSEITKEWHEPRPPSINLTPFYALNRTGTSHEIAANLMDDSGSPIPDITITFNIISGPHSGFTGTGKTNAAGQTAWSYNGTSPGTDIIVASGDGVSSNEINKEWFAPRSGPPSSTITLAPLNATNSPGATHTLTATLMDDTSFPLQGITMTFNIISGPHSGLTGTGITNADGQTNWSYTGTSLGTDTIVASGAGVSSNTALKIWEIQMGVGGEIQQINKLPLIISWLILILVIILGGIFLVSRRRKRS